MAVQFDSNMNFGPRRAGFVNIQTALADQQPAATGLTHNLEDLDLIYRTLCGVLYNFVPQSGHPGGSISSGRIVESLLYSGMDYDMSNPDEKAADLISYAAGHKAMGLYAMWALRDEILQQHEPTTLPMDVRKRLRLEDLLGFRSNPTQHTPLFKKFNAKPLDGHPSPLVPFVKLSTGASGVGIPSSFGLGVAARDYFGNQAPTVNVIEGEGGLTPGRTHEAMAMAATAGVNNLIMHLDWNQASIDSDRVCREGDQPGDYVQWDPMEYGWLHDWNVILVPDGFDFQQILAAQELALSRPNRQPTLIVYRTVKGWHYGIEGRASHGAGHKFCSDEFYSFTKPFAERFGHEFPRFSGDKSDDAVELLFYEFLLVIRKVLGEQTDLVQFLGNRLTEAKARLAKRNRTPRSGAGDVSRVYGFNPTETPSELTLKSGDVTTLRASLAKSLNYLNRQSQGAIVASAADLYGSTSIKSVGDGFAAGFWDAADNPESRIMSVGGICEDAMGALMAGYSAFGTGIGTGSSYGAFIASLQHIAARLHGIGQQGKQDYNDEAFNPFILVAAHAGLKTGEDGPTHADPQPLQLLQENFPRGVMVTLTPWDPAEIWPLLVAALNSRPAIVAPFVTRPNETVVDRAAMKLAPVADAVQGVYALRRAQADDAGVVVLQGSGVTNTFIQEVLPKLDADGAELNIYYVASSELFDLLPTEKQQMIFPWAHRERAIGISGFTLPTLYRWVLSDEGRHRSLYPFRNGRYLGSGQAHKVLEEAGLHGEGQYRAIQSYLSSL